ncbi:hypothetical protein [Amycolatopsis sp. NPDC049159]|uniref:hypothetical protein n=1 Tax=Amycolatopsis sp. NPDC049159 TaxID=3157210 RepID=UPI00340DCE75
MADHSPRSASMLLSGALAHLDVIQPEALRGPVRDILRAGIELCVGSRSLLGKPIRPALDLAQAVMDTAEGEKRRDDEGQG